MNGWKWRRVVAITRFVDLMVLRRKMRLMDGFFYFTLIWFFFLFGLWLSFSFFLLFSFSFPTPPATYFLRFPSFQVSIAPIIRQIFFFFRSLIGELEALGFIFIWGGVSDSDWSLAKREREKENKNEKKKKKKKKNVTMPATAAELLRFSWLSSSISHWLWPQYIYIYIYISV